MNQFKGKKETPKEERRQQMKIFWSFSFSLKLNVKLCFMAEN